MARANEAPRPREYIEALVSGRPKRLRDKAQLAMIAQAFIDESGYDRATFVVGGYVGPVKMWAQFAEDWQEVLDLKPKMPPLHMIHAVDFDEEYGFHVFSERTLEERLLLLAGVIHRHAPQSFVVEMIGAKAARSILQSIVPKALYRKAYPYVVSASVLLGDIGVAHRRRHWTGGKVQPIFDYHQQFRGPMRELIERELVNDEQWKDFSTPLWPLPRDRPNYVPLQAADLLVWHWRRFRDHSDGAKRPVFKALRKASRPRIRTVWPIDVYRGALAGHGVDINSPTASAEIQRTAEQLRADGKFLALAREWKKRNLPGGA